MHGHLLLTRVECVNCHHEYIAEESTNCPKCNGKSVKIISHGPSSYLMLGGKSAKKAICKKCKHIFTNYSVDFITSKTTLARCPTCKEPASSATIKFITPKEEEEMKECEESYKRTFPHSVALSLKPQSKCRKCGYPYLSNNYDANFKCPQCKEPTSTAITELP